MSWHCSLALVEEFSRLGCLDGVQSALLRSTRIAEKSSFGARKRATSKRSRSGMMSDRLMARPGVEAWMSSLRASPASRSASRGSTKAKAINETSGLTPFALYDRSDRDGACWRTSQVSLLTNTMERFWGHWPKAAMMLDGIAYPRVSLVPDNFVSAFGLLRPPERWATPRSRYRGTTVDKRGKRAGGGASTIEHEIALLGGRGPVNPTFREQLMGFPTEWTALSPLDKRKFQQWLEQHGSS